jgi:carboxyl-terminal processing protease
VNSLLILIFLAVTPTALVWAQAQPPDTELTCAGVLDIQKRYLERHLVYHEFTPEIEKRVIKLYLKRTDPEKLNLLESEFQKIESSLQGIFSKIKNGDCSALIQANAVIVKRVASGVELVKQLLGPDFKIDRSLKIETDLKKRKWAKSEEELKKAILTRAQFDVANYVASDIGLEAAKKHVLKNNDRGLKHAQKQRDKDVLGAFLDVFATALDPHSNYMPAEAHEDFEISMKLALDGIGASLGWKNGFTIVERLLPGGAALASGQVKPKDKILGVAQGKDGEFVDVIEMELRDVIKLIRGKKGSVVRLQIVRRVKGQVERHEVTLVRDKITLEDQAAFVRYFDREVNGRKLKIALLNLPSFYDDQTKDGKSATSDLKRLVQEAIANKADSLVLDLSYNGGGSLQDAVDVAGLFLPSGNILKVGRGGQFQMLVDEEPKTYWNGPLVILSNRGSASASEIVAGALQDYRRAVIVGGDHTYGKGTVQAVEQLAPGLGGMKTTTAMFYTAGGYSTQHRGVPGDIVFPSVLAREELSEKSLEYSLAPQKTPSFLTYSAFTMIGPERWQVINKDMLDNLRKKATPRIKASTDFKKALVELKKPPPPSLVSIESIVKGKDPASTKDETEEKDELAPSREERIKEYLKRADVLEAVNIAADLVQEMGP